MTYVCYDPNFESYFNPELGWDCPLSEAKVFLDLPGDWKEYDGCWLHISNAKEFESFKDEAELRIREKLLGLSVTDRDVDNG